MCEKLLLVVSHFTSARRKTSKGWVFFFWYFAEDYLQILVCYQIEYNDIENYTGINWDACFTYVFPSVSLNRMFPCNLFHNSFQTKKLSAF